MTRSPRLESWLAFDGLGLPADALWQAPSSDFQPLVVDLLPVKDAQAEQGGQGNMLGVTNGKAFRCTGPEARDRVADHMCTNTNINHMEAHTHTQFLLVQ